MGENITEMIEILLEQLLLISLLAMPVVVVVMWVCVIVFAVKLRKIPKDDEQRRAKAKRRVKRLIITASVMTVSLIALYVWFSVAVIRNM